MRIPLLYTNRFEAELSLALGDGITAGARGGTSYYLCLYCSSEKVIGSSKAINAV